MKFIKEAGIPACILCLGQALMPASFAQMPAKGAGPDPIVSIGTGQLRGSPTADGLIGQSDPPPDCP